MYGNAEGPKTFDATRPTKSSMIIYTLTQNDRDTGGPFGSLPFTDLTCNISAVRIESMAGPPGVSQRGPDATGTFFWDVSGPARASVGVYRDEWLMFNNRAQGDIYRDQNISQTQVVILNEP